MIENHQVGKQLKSKDLPVKRERDALEDIMNSKEHKGKTYYHSYESDMKLEVTKNNKGEIEYRKAR